jgi:hypothetical protein
VAAAVAASPENRNLRRCIANLFEEGVVITAR